MLDAVDVFITPLREMLRLLNATLTWAEQQVPVLKGVIVWHQPNNLSCRTESLLIATRIVFIV